jgi:hypothetical protein
VDPDGSAKGAIGLENPLLPGANSTFRGNALAFHDHGGGVGVDSVFPVGNNAGGIGNPPVMLVTNRWCGNRMGNFKQDWNYPYKCMSMSKMAGS